VINLKALENLDTTVDDLFMDLRMSDPEMKVSFDMNNPSQMHELQIRGMTCDLLVYKSEHDKHLLGKLVSEDKLISKPGRHRVSHNTSLQQVSSARKRSTTTAADTTIFHVYYYYYIINL
jgi:hypothetical protein